MKEEEKRGGLAATLFCRGVCSETGNDNIMSIARHRTVKSPATVLPGRSMEANLTNQIVSRIYCYCEDNKVLLIDRKRTLFNTVRKEGTLDVRRQD
jgi:hypothetical protein